VSERQRDPEVAKKPAYISYCRRCGGMTGACADTPERAKDAAQFVSECIAAGLIIERKTAAFPRVPRCVLQCHYPCR
jgi:hypothetical protein